MLFKQNHLDGIRNGKFRLAFRRWKKSSVKAGTRLKTSIGEVEILAISTVTENKITESDAKQAGFENKVALMQSLLQSSDGEIFRIEVKFAGEDPRIALRSTTRLSAGEINLLREKLERMDKNSSVGAWTNKVLTAISKSPRLRAVDLAKKTGYEKDWLKLNIRKLKNLGLTISHEIGYEISPLGEWWLKQYDAH